MTYKRFMIVILSCLLMYLHSLFLFYLIFFSPPPFFSPFFFFFTSLVLHPVHTAHAPHPTARQQHNPFTTNCPSWYNNNDTHCRCNDNNTAATHSNTCSDYSSWPLDTTHNPRGHPHLTAHTDHNFPPRQDRHPGVRASYWCRHHRGLYLWGWSNTRNYGSEW